MDVYYGQAPELKQGTDSKSPDLIGLLVGGVVGQAWLTRSSCGTQALLWPLGKRSWGS